jgi:hypothetical protein
LIKPSSTSKELAAENRERNSIKAKKEFKKKKLTKEKGIAQPNCPSEKICVDCKKPYKPTSNVQKRCPDCKIKHDKSYAKAYAATNGGKDGIRKTPKQKPTVPPVIHIDNGGNHKPRINGEIFPYRHVMSNAIGIFSTLAECGCRTMIFQNVKIILEKI